MLDFPNLTLLLQRCRPAGADAWGNSAFYRDCFAVRTRWDWCLFPRRLSSRGITPIFLYRLLRSENLLGLCFLGDALLFLCVRALWKTHGKTLETQHETDRKCPNFSVPNFTRYMTVRQVPFSCLSDQSVFHTPHRDGRRWSYPPPNWWLFVSDFASVAGRADPCHIQKRYIGCGSQNPSVF